MSCARAAALTGVLTTAHEGQVETAMTMWHGCHHPVAADCDAASSIASANFVAAMKHLACVVSCCWRLDLVD